MYANELIIIIIMQNAYFSHCDGYVIVYSIWMLKWSFVLKKLEHSKLLIL